MAFYVYILASQRNGTLYIGQTDSIGRRVLEHRESATPGFTAIAHRPIGDVEIALKPEVEEHGQLAPGEDTFIYIDFGEVPPGAFEAIRNGGMVVLVRVRAEYDFEPGKVDVAEVTMVIAEDAIRTGIIPTLSQHERQRP
jgi:hypothetical protein